MLIFAKKVELYSNKNSNIQEISIFKEIAKEIYLLVFGGTTFYETVHGAAFSRSALGPESATTLSRDSLFKKTHATISASRRKAINVIVHSQVKFKLSVFFRGPKFSSNLSKKQKYS